MLLLTAIIIIVRTIVEACGKTIEWDGPNFSVYVGERAARTEPDVWLKDYRFISGTTQFFPDRYAALGDCGFYR